MSLRSTFIPLRSAARGLLAGMALLLGGAPASAAILEFTFVPGPANDVGILGSFQVDASSFVGLSGTPVAVSNSAIIAFDFTDGTNSWDIGEVLDANSMDYDLTGPLPQLLGASLGLANPVASDDGVIDIAFQAAGGPFAGPAIFRTDMFDPTATGSWTTTCLGNDCPDPTQALPEPGVLLLASAGLAGIGLARRRRS